MIITKQKTKEYILESLAGYKNIFLIGCGDCATTTKTGGAHEVKEMSDYLKKKGFHVTGSVTPDTSCVEVQLRRALREHAAALEAADAILMLTCGSGVQAVVKTLTAKKPVLVACDTLCIGVMDKGGKQFFEFCSACGECILNETAGMCPITRCPKNMVNGPCGGMRKGKCEIDTARDCVWALIYEACPAGARREALERIRAPKHWSSAGKPRAHGL